MKKFFSVFIICFICNSAIAQNNPPSPIIYSNVEKVEGVVSSELFARAQQWFATSYNNSKQVLRMVDNNRLVGMSLFTFHYNGGLSGTAHCKIEYTITIECRDGRYKYTIDSIYLHVRPHGISDYSQTYLLTDAYALQKESAWKTNMSDNHRQKMWQMAKEKTDIYMKQLIISLNSFMNKSYTNDNW